MTDENDTKSIFTAAALALLIAALLITLASCGEAKADYVLEFGATWCGPCQAQKPVVAQVRREGYDVRPVDFDERKDLVAYYRITKVPTCVYVISTARGDFDSGCRIVGIATAAQLRRFCVAPGVVTVGSAARNAIGAVLSPVPVIVVVP